MGRILEYECLMCGAEFEADDTNPICSECGETECKLLNEESETE